MALVVSAGFGIATDFVVHSRREGDCWIVRGTFLAGTVAASAGFISLPSGLTINRKILTNRTAKIHLGFFMSINSGTSTIGGGNFGAIFYDGLDPLKLFFGYQTSGGAFTKNNVSDFQPTNLPISFDFCVPIEQWEIV